jgi:hypothetical protein
VSAAPAGANTTLNVLGLEKAAAEPVGATPPNTDISRATPHTEAENTHAPPRNGQTASLPEKTAAGPVGATPAIWQAPTALPHLQQTTVAALILLIA